MSAAEVYFSYSRASGPTKLYVDNFAKQFFKPDLNLTLVDPMLLLNPAKLIDAADIFIAFIDRDYGKNCERELERWVSLHKSDQFLIPITLDNDGQSWWYLYCLQHHGMRVREYTFFTPGIMRLGP